MAGPPGATVPLGAEMLADLGRVREAAKQAGQEIRALERQMKTAVASGAAMPAGAQQRLQGLQDIRLRATEMQISQRERERVERAADAERRRDWNFKQYQVRAREEWDRDRARALSGERGSLLAVGHLMTGTVARKLLRGEAIGADDLLTLSWSLERTAERVLARWADTSPRLGQLLGGALRQAPLLGTAIGAWQEAFQEIEADAKAQARAGALAGRGQWTPAEFELSQKVGGAKGFAAVQRRQALAKTMLGLSEDALARALTPLLAKHTDYPQWMVPPSTQEEPDPAQGRARALDILRRYREAVAARQRQYGRELTPDERLREMREVLSGQGFSEDELTRFEELAARESVKSYRPRTASVMWAETESAASAAAQTSALHRRAGGAARVELAGPAPEFFGGEINAAGRADAARHAAATSAAVARDAEPLRAAADRERLAPRED